MAFFNCRSLRRINLKFAAKIDQSAFNGCIGLTNVEFGEALETMGNYAFQICKSLKHLKLPSIITIGLLAFYDCKNLIDIELSGRLERIERSAFKSCERLQRIVIPLKRDLFVRDECYEEYNQFHRCEQLTTVDLAGQAHTKTVASLHMESWRTEMIAAINRINQVLPNTPANEKTDKIRQWMNSVIDRLDHYKAEHYRYAKEGMTLLELALWKAKLGEKEDNCGEGRSKKAKVDGELSRRDKRITCGANMVIKNVLPFLY